MTPDATPPAARAPEATKEVKGKSLGWQLLQVGALATLLLAGMYEVDLDAKALAEKRARPALLHAFEAAAERVPSASSDLALERAIESYTKICSECAAIRRCEEMIKSIRVERKIPAGRGPCKEGIFERWSSDGTAGVSRAQ